LALIIQSSKQFKSIKKAEYKHSAFLCAPGMVITL